MPPMSRADHTYPMPPNAPLRATGRTAGRWRLKVRHLITGFGNIPLPEQGAKIAVKGGLNRWHITTFCMAFKAVLGTLRRAYLHGIARLGPAQKHEWGHLNFRRRDAKTGGNRPTQYCRKIKIRQQFFAVSGAGNL